MQSGTRVRTKHESAHLVFINNIICPYADVFHLYNKLEGNFHITIFIFVDFSRFFRFNIYFFCAQAITWLFVNFFFSSKIRLKSLWCLIVTVKVEVEYKTVLEKKNISKWLELHSTLVNHHTYSIADIFFFLISCCSS